MLFVNLGLRLENHSPEAAANVSRVLAIAQAAIHKWEGSLNKFLMDDKGSTLIAVFGLPPLAHEDEPVRALYAAMQIVANLLK